MCFDSETPPTAEARVKKLGNDTTLVSEGTLTKSDTPRVGKFTPAPTPPPLPVRTFKVNYRPEFDFEGNNDILPEFVQAQEIHVVNDFIHFDLSEGDEDPWFGAHTVRLISAAYVRSIERVDNETEHA